jgi:hypothetical protein
MQLHRRSDTTTKEGCLNKGFWLFGKGLSWSSGALHCFGYGFWWIFYFGEISLERDIVLVEESLLKKIYWVFSPTRVS